MVKGAQILSPKVANVASDANYLWPGSRACLRALEALEILMLNYA